MTSPNPSEGGEKPLSYLPEGEKPPLLWRGGGGRWGR